MITIKMKLCQKQRRKISVFSAFMKKLLNGIILIIFVTNLTTGQTILAPGDIAIIGFNTSTSGSTPPCNSNQDNFAFVLLVDIAAGTTIYFSDDGVYATGCLRHSEGIIKYTAPAGGITKGTIIAIDTKDDAACLPNIIRGSGTVIHESGGTSMDLNVSGEQLIVFQDDGVNITCPDTYLFALTNNDVWQADATDSHTSALPPGLTDGVNAIAIPKNPGFQNNAYFDCTLAPSGSKEDILAALVDPVNWMGSTGTTYPLPDCIFSIGGLQVSAITYDQMRLLWSDPGSTTEEMIVVAKAGSAITIDPTGNDGSTWTANTTFGSGTNIGDNTFLLYKAVSIAPDTTFIVTGLTEGTTYYYKIFSHIPLSTSWIEGDATSGHIAKVQNITDPLLTLTGTKTVTAGWDNYTGTPQSAWWDGGTMIIGKAGSAVGVTRADLNAQSNSVSDYTAGQNLNALGGNFTGCFVAGLDLTGTPGATENLALTGINVCMTYYFKIFHNDGDVSNHDRWSDGIDLGSVTTLCPEMKVEGNSIEIVDGDITPDYTDYTNFGAIMENSTLSYTYKIKNTGTGELTLSGVPKVTITGTVFTVTTQPLSPVAASGETTFQITFSAPNDCPGSPYTETVSITNDDTNENPYNFSITGSCNNNCTSLSPTSGTAGTTVIITGIGFTGSTTVSFNGAAATVTAWTATQLTVTVPVSATTGTVTTASPAINSCNVFTIISAAGTCIH